MANRLQTETSPYLTQHAADAVDWFPWGEEAFDKARAEDKPVFLSVGYSACHWCHVMQSESFQDPLTADVLNREFVSVKVDREERPDIDEIYVNAVLAMTGHAGWPLSVFLTADKTPFYGGTYFPSDRRGAGPSFREVLDEIANAWKTRRDEAVKAAGALAESLRRDELSTIVGSEEPLERSTLERAVSVLGLSFDRDHGGFGAIPKFPHPSIIEFLLGRFVQAEDVKALLMATQTLDAMAAGGIHDHLGGGFHRYSTDMEWKIPHFEKMLYDNAQLASVYLHAWQITGDPHYRGVATQTLDYIRRDLSEPARFYSSVDADSERREGAYYVWTPKEIRDALAADTGYVTLGKSDVELFFDAYGVTEQGDFDDANVLHRVIGDEMLAEAHELTVEEVSSSLARIRSILLRARDRRPRPMRDEKVLAAWNGLALSAFAEAARVLGREDYLSVALDSADFLLRELRRPGDRLMRTWKDRRAHVNGYLEDYAAVSAAMLQLYQTTFDERWFAAAAGLADSMLEHFADPEGGFFDTSDDHEELIARPKNLQDGAMPSGGALASTVLLRLAALTGDHRYAAPAEQAIVGVQNALTGTPLGFGQWLCALEFVLAPPTEVAIVGTDPSRLLDVITASYRPTVVVAVGSGRHPAEAHVPLLEGRTPVEGRPAAYVCRRSVCQEPISEPAELASLLSR